jgi:putative DNA primase/helicase
MTDARTIATTLGLRRSGAVFLGACPSCGYADAFSAKDVDGRTLFRCHAGCEQADVMDALRRAGAWGGHASNDTPLPARPVARGGPEMRGGQSDASEVALRIWHASRPLVGTVGESYLRRARGLAGIEMPADLRFAPALKHPTGNTWPAMVAAVRNLSGKVVAIHRTFLRPDGDGKAPVLPAKMTLGPIGGGAVRLAPAGPHLVIGEGLESTMSAMLGSGLPGWCGLSAGGVRRMILPADVVMVTVTSVKLVEIRVRREVAIGQAARGGIWMGSAVSVAASSAMASTCM